MRLSVSVQFLLATMALLSLTCVQSASAVQADEPVSWRARRIELDAQYEADLEQIVQWCRDNGLEEKAQPTLELIINRDPHRQYIFLPSESSMPAVAGGLPGQWLEKVNSANVAHAQRILELAKQAADEEFGAIAFQLLHEVIHYDRDQADVRKMLGHRKADDGWKVASDSIRVKNVRTRHPDFGWAPNQHILVLTPHFEIESDASEERTRFLAEKLERWESVWRQVFVEYWSSPAAVKRWIAGSASVTKSSKRFRVVFFGSRDEYLRQLGKTVRGIQKSTGYYSSNERTSFFYDGNEQVQDTWRHELTHQLFRESGRTNDNTLAEQFIWIDEGVATYFESLADFGDYVTLGGFDARRIQYSRIRRLLENFHIPINELSAFGRKDLQQHSDIERVYSEAAGLTDMLMNDQQGAYEKPLTEFLWLIHKGKVKPGTFQKIIGQTYQQLDDRYQEHLAVDSDTVARFLSKPESRTELSLPGANLQTAAFKQIAKCTNLTFLDLSKNAITTDQFVLLKDCQKINRLLLTSCSFEDGPIRGFELFPLLNDLDLSGSSIQDSQLSTFKYLPNLASLRLAVTGITDEGLAHLADVPGLTSLDLTRTKVTDQGIAKLRQRLPNLKVVR